MAAIERPSPTFFAAVLNAVCIADPRRDTAASVFDGLVSALDDGQAEHLASGLGGILELLAGDLDRLRFAASAIVQFDMAESAEYLVRLAIETQDRDLLLSAAAICGNPAVSSELRSAMQRALAGDRLSLMRLRNDIVPETAHETLLYHQIWPGKRQHETASRLPPVVVLDQDLGTRAVLLAAVHIVRCGGVVRQLNPRTSVPDWFGPATVLVCTGATLAAISPKLGDLRSSQVISDPRIATGADAARLVRRINTLLPPSLKLRLPSTDVEQATEVWDPDVYRLGAYKTTEASYLTSAPASSFRTLVRKEHLSPRRIGKRESPVWSFRDIVGVRAWRRMMADSGRRLPPRVVKPLVEFTGSENAVSVGVTADGRVWSRQNGTNGDNPWVDIVTDEQMMHISMKELTTLDDVFSPFELGGIYAPDLLHPSTHTRLHPATLNGQPYLDGHRIPARALAELDTRGGRETIVAAYPELEEAAFDDTVREGHRLAGASRP